MTSEKILNFWFGEPSSLDYGLAKTFWFESSSESDKQIKDKFKDTYEMARTGQLENWINTAEGSLSLVLLLDQFSRNMFRGTPQAFATDGQALNTALTAINNGFDQILAPFQRKFIYMPFMHSENLAHQIKGVELFSALGDKITLDYAIQHRDIIARFGRFPHRNEILKRSSTEQEIEFLRQPGSSF